jgi:uncharacterized protein (TIGR00369 family)
VATRREVVAQFIPHSPLARHLGIEIERLEPDVAVLGLPFAEHNVTIGGVIHGGAISALADTACMAAAWSDDEEAGPGGSTISLSVDFAAPATETALHARADVYRRGRTCFCTVAVTDDAGTVVASGLATYRFAQMA